MMLRRPLKLSIKVNAAINRKPPVLDAVAGSTYRYVDQECVKDMPEELDDEEWVYTGGGHMFLMGSDGKVSGRILR
jgi:hypothetical protein